MYTPEQLRFSARARCRCGAGLAYPLDGNLRGCWECSAVLLGEATPSLDHDGPRPFTFWEVKSEHESGDDSTTTRPGGKIDRERTRQVDEERNVDTAGYPPELLANPEARR